MQLKHSKTSSNTNILNKIKVNINQQNDNSGRIDNNNEAVNHFRYNIFFGICGSIINICTCTYKSILKLSPMKNNYIK